MSTMPRLMSRKCPNVKSDLLDAQRAQSRTRPLERGLLDTTAGWRSRRRKLVNALKSTDGEAYW